MRIFLRLAVVLCVLSPVPALAAVVTLAWDPSIGPDVTGYQLEVGTASGTTDVAIINVGNVTSWPMPNLVAGQIYYFSVRAYTADGIFSDRAPEVSLTVPIVRPTGRLTYDPVAGTWSSPLKDQYGNTPANGPGWTVLTGDLNGDGWQDLFLYNRITGAWLKAIDEHDGTYGFFGYTWAPGWTPTIGDFNGDGRADVFLYNAVNGQWFMCLSPADGGDFTYIKGLWAPGWTLTAGDFNGDGRTDLFLYNNRPATVDPANSGRWFRALAQADGSFEYLEGDSRWLTDWQITTGDFNGDGQTDLFLYRPTGQWVQVFFTADSESYSGGLWAPGWTIVPGDFDGDHRTDLFLYNATNGHWFVAQTMPDGSFGYFPGLWGPNWTIRPTDLNGDGRTDLVLYNVTSGTWFEATSTLQPGTFSFTTGTGVASAALTIIR